MRIQKFDIRGLCMAAAVISVAFAVLFGSAFYLDGPAAQEPGEFEEILRNPLRPHDQSRRVDRLVRIDTADAFRAGESKLTVVGNGMRLGIILAEDGQLGFPRRGTWTSPETMAEFSFTELTPSWNVIAPKDSGAFFQVRTRDAKSHEWSPWIFVGRWGRTVHARRDERVPTDKTFRFAWGAALIDIPLVLLSRPADAYQIRATLQSFDLDPSVSPRVRRLTVAYSGEVADPTERARLLSPGGPVDGWAIDLKIPHVSQYSAPPNLRDSVCLPACVTMILAHWKIDRTLAENSLAIYDPDTGMFGNGARAVARAGDLGLEAWMQRFHDWGEVKAMISRGEPIIASIVVEGAAHLIVIRGFTKEGEVIVNDPLDQGKGGKTLNAEKLGKQWFDCGGFACVIRRPS